MSFPEIGLAHAAWVMPQKFAYKGESIMVSFQMHKSAVQKLKFNLHFSINIALTVMDHHDRKLPQSFFRKVKSPNES